MGTLVMLGQFIFSLSFLIILHECGHFFPARWFKTRVEKFYLFFDPGFSLFKMKKGDTEYGIGWLPLGGYVKISGMIDESFDKEQMEGPPQPWEFRSKPAWQRLIIMLGGVTVNFALGIIIFGAILFTWGKSHLSNEKAIHGIAVEELGVAIGLENGDRILSVGDFEPTIFDPGETIREIIINEARTITVERNGAQVVLPVSDSLAKSFASFDNKDKLFYGPRIPVTIAQIAEGYPAEKAGLQVEDQILSLNGSPTYYYDQYTAKAQEFKDQVVNIGLLRGNDTLHIEAQLDTVGRLGYFPYGPLNYYDPIQTEYTFSEAAVGGWNEAWGFLGDQIKAFGQMFAGKLPFRESLGGPIAIATMFKNKGNPKKWDWYKTWRLTAMLSMILAFMNLLPIPALDGGHVMFLLWEVLTGKKPSDQVLEYATLGGFILVMIFMIFVFGNDIARLF